MELCWIFPVSVSFATVAISSGVSGALFFSPFFMLVLGLSLAQAIGAGLLTEVFGMGNGLRLYYRGLPYTVVLDRELRVVRSFYGFGDNIDPIKETVDRELAN